MATLHGMAGGTVHSIAFSPHGGTVAATINDGTHKNYAIYVSDSAGKYLTKFHNTDSAGGTMLAFSPNGSMLAVGDENAHTYIWDMSWHNS